MGQILVPDKIGIVSHSSGVVSLAASTLSIGGQQYRTGALSRTISTDVTLVANTRYRIFAVVSGGVVALRVSTNTNSVGPAGFLSWKLVESFNTDASAAFSSFGNAPTIQKFTGSSGSYAPRDGVKWIEVLMSGGGGGGGKAATASNGSNGSAGGTSYFRVGASPDLLVANGGAGGSGGSTAGGQPSGGAGGTASLGSGPTGYAVTGGGGHYGWNFTAIAYNPGGHGGQNPLGGSGAMPFLGVGAVGAANTGAGGGGGGINPGSGSQSGAGGGAGGFLIATIKDLAASYNWAVGAGGTGGTATGAGSNGGDGAAGVIVIKEYYDDHV